MSCPTQGLEFDPRTLRLLDTDGDGRIRVPEVLAAVRWTLKRLKDPAALLRGGEALALDAIEDRDEEGRRLLASARRILENLGKPEARAITADDTEDPSRVFGQARFNGDGVIPPECVADEGTRRVLEEIVLCLGAADDRSGRPGASRAKAQAFFEECRAYAEWAGLPEADPSRGILPLGEGTAKAYAALQAVRAKADDFFLRCRMAAYDPDSAAALDRREQTLASAACKLLTAELEELKALPAGRVSPRGRLPLREGANPAWQSALAELRARAAGPLLGEERAELSEADWERLKAFFAPYEAWLAAKRGGAVERLGLERIRKLLSGGPREAVEALIAADAAVRGEIEAIEEVDRLVRYHRDLLRLLNNYVSFSEFYGRRSPAVFEAGRLYIDGRRCDLCLRVADMARHSALASESRTFLIYCECSRKDVSERMTIAAALTGGDSDHIFAGRNGVFYDRRGRDWDATVVKVVEHPISIAQAVWSPYKSLARFVGEQVEKFASIRDKLAIPKAAAGAAPGAKPPEPAHPLAPAAPFDVARFAGIFAAFGLAAGGLAAGIGKLVETFVGLLWWQKPLVVLGPLVAVSGPSALIAWLKLRQRNLGPLLDANGWAINGRVKINIAFGNAVTSTAKLPPDAVRRLTDPYAPKERRLLVKAGIAMLLSGLAVLSWVEWDLDLIRRLVGRLF